MSDIVDDTAAQSAAPGDDALNASELDPRARGEPPPSPFPVPTPGNHYMTSDSLGQEPSPAPGNHYVMNDSLGQEPPPVVTALVPKEAERTPAQPAAARRNLAAARHVAYVAQLDRRVRTTATKTMLTAMRAPEVAACGPPPDMTKTELRIARDAMIPEKDAPVYLRMASRILDGYKRAEILSERDPAPRLNVETIQVAVSNTYNYEVIEAPEDKR